jgi:hypothetical protein
LGRRENGEAHDIFLGFREELSAVRVKKQRPSLCSQSITVYRSEQLQPMNSITRFRVSGQSKARRGGGQGAKHYDVEIYSDRARKTVCAHEGWNSRVTRTTGALKRFIGNFKNKKCFIWTIRARLAHSTSHQIQ